MGFSVGGFSLKAHSGELEAWGSGCLCEVSEFKV